VWQCQRGVYQVRSAVLLDLKRKKKKKKYEPSLAKIPAPKIAIPGELEVDIYLCKTVERRSLCATVHGILELAIYIYN